MISYIEDNVGEWRPCLLIFQIRRLLYELDQTFYCGGRCDGCIAFHVHDVLVAGASHEEVIEAIRVAILMGGGPSVVYGTQALEALKEF